MLTRINPLSYVVEPMRRSVFAHLDVDPAVRARLDGIAGAQFRRTD